MTILLKNKNLTKSLFQNQISPAQIWRKYLFFEKLWDICDVFAGKRFFQYVTARVKCYPTVTTWINKAKVSGSSMVCDRIMHKKYQISRYRKQNRPDLHVKQAKIETSGRSWI